MTLDSTSHVTNNNKGTYVETTDNRLKELSRFQDFLYRNFHNYECYKDIQPASNQPALLYGTAKTHKFETLEYINVAKLKFDLSLIKLERLRTMRRKLYQII